MAAPAIVPFSDDDRPAHPDMSTSAAIAILVRKIRITVSFAKDLTAVIARG
jgi:hypothetical protein